MISSIMSFAQQKIAIIQSNKGKDINVRVNALYARIALK
jgi:hypothetical protein